MIIPYSKIFLILFFYSFLLCDDESIRKLNEEKNKIQKEIDNKDKEIEALNKDLELIRKKITNTTTDLNSKTRQAIKGQKDLIELEQEIEKTDTKLNEIESEINKTDALISKQKDQIAKQEGKIDSIEIIIDTIILEFKKRSKKTYRVGSKKTLKWKEKKYLKELNQYADRTDLNKEEEYLSKLLILDKNKLKLEEALKELEISLISKKKLLIFKKKAKQDLIKSKEKKRNILSQLKKEKKELEEKLDNKKQEEIEKQKQIKMAQQLIEELFKDKEKNKGRREDLIRIRLEQNKEISGNFSKMKGKLQWPVNGIIISKFGNQINPELNTITENTGIEIECRNDAQIISVMDGIIMAISYIPIYGNIIIIDHGEEYTTVYANLDEIFVYENDYVSPGTIIGKISKSKNQKGNLHFEVWQKNKKLNPEFWLLKK